MVKDGAEWLPRCLHGLSRQTYPRLGVIAIDNGSTDESVELLEGTLGAARVIPLNRNLGFPGAVAAALRSDVAQQSDYVLLMHDDTVLAPNAVANLVAAAERIDGVGVVGPKVLDWQDPQVLREIGYSTDRFGYPYSPLDEGEIDQGQYERIRDVLFVSSCAMLVSRALWTRIGPPDERLAGSHDDLDYCWRARLAGFKVLMTPLAVAHHREATTRGKRPGGPEEIRIRYERERAALASMLKNYSFFSLLWVLPLYLILGLLRVAVFVLSRKFEDAYQLLSAWRWNVVRLPGTILRRWRAQRVRAVRDRVVRQSMAPAGIRLRRWVLAAASALLPQPVAEPEGGRPVPVVVKVARYVGAHPVAVAWGVGIVVALAAYRNLFGASPLVGGALGVPPDSPLDYFRELTSGLRHTGLGGNYAASPALAILGVGSGVALGSPAFFQKILLLALPVFAAVGAYRAVQTATGTRVPPAVAGVCYGVSSLILWGVSTGRLAALVFLAGVPWLVTKLGLPFRREFRVPPIRWVAGAGVGLGVLMAFFPGTLLVAVLAVLSLSVFPITNPRRTEAVLLALAAIAVGGVLIFPLAIDFMRSGGSAFGSEAGGGTFEALARLSLRPGPGLWRTGFYLPLAVAIGLPFVTNQRTEAFRAAGLAVVALYLAWLSARGYLPEPVSNSVAYLGLLAFQYVFLLGLALASLASMKSSSRQSRVAIGALGVVIGLGLLTQVAQAARGRWTVG
ncbi:MAG: glycosyltransferase family 2 protein, partial [Actinomycetota bacterium]|nr:glycosyltransferase family 2 protein [Actinomycetota bacterium]